MEVHYNAKGPLPYWTDQNYADHELAAVFIPTKFGCLCWPVSAVIIGTAGFMAEKALGISYAACDCGILAVAAFAWPVACASFVTHMDFEHYDHEDPHLHLMTAVRTAYNVSASVINTVHGKITRAKGSSEE